MHAGDINQAALEQPLNAHPKCEASYLIQRPLRRGFGCRYLAGQDLSDSNL